MLLAPDSIRGGLRLGMTALVLSHHATVTLPIGGGFLFEAVASLFGPALSSLFTTLASAEDMASLFGAAASSTYGTMFAGNAAAGALLATIGAGGAFLGDAGSFTLSVLGIATVRLAPEGTPRHPGADPFLPPLAQGLTLLWRSAALGRLTVLAFALVALGWPVDVLGPAWVRDEVHGAAVVYGPLGAALTLGAVLGGLIGAVLGRATRPARPVTAGSVASGLAIVVVSRLPNVRVTLAMYLVIGADSGLLSPAIGALPVGDVPAHARGRLSGALAAVQALALPRGAALAGAAGASLPLPLQFLLSGGATAVASVAVMEGAGFGGPAPAATAPAAGGLQPLVACRRTAQRLA